MRGFKIAYRLAGVAASTFIIRKIANSAATQGNIDGLVQFTAYEIKVLAYNDAGDGTYSNPITVTTSEGSKLYSVHLFICRFSSDIQTGKRQAAFSLLLVKLNFGKDSQICTRYNYSLFHQQRDFLLPIILGSPFLSYPSVKCEFVRGSYSNITYIT